MCPVRISTRSSRHAQLLLLYTHPGAGMSLPLASCCSCCINQSNLHANKRKGCGLPNQLKTQLLPTCQIFRDREIPDIPEVAPKYRVMTQDPVHANDHRLAPIPAPLCFGQESQADWHTRLNYELISLLIAVQLKLDKMGSPHEFAPVTNETQCVRYNWRLSGTPARRLGQVPLRWVS